MIRELVGGALSFIPVVGGALSNVVASTGDSGSKRVSKSEFYAARDTAYAQISSVYGDRHYEKLPGNPFAAFSHASISDSPFKNYAGEMAALQSALAKYYPSLFGAAPAPRTPTITNDPPASTPDPVTGEMPDNGTKGKGVPWWVWALGAVLLLGGKKIFR